MLAITRLGSIWLVAIIPKSRSPFRTYNPAGILRNTPNPNYSISHASEEFCLTLNSSDFELALIKCGISSKNSVGALFSRSNLSIPLLRRLYPHFTSELFIFYRLSLQLPRRPPAAGGAHVLRVQQISWSLYRRRRWSRSFLFVFVVFAWRSQVLRNSGLQTAGNVLSSRTFISSHWTLERTFSEVGDYTDREGRLVEFSVVLHHNPCDRYAVNFHGSD